MLTSMSLEFEVIVGKHLTSEIFHEVIGLIEQRRSWQFLLT